MFCRRELTDYYKAISDPISLNLIKRKMKSGDYSSLQDLADDMGKQFQLSARSFYQRLWC